MKSNALKSIFAQRKFRYGTVATLLTIGVIVLVILLNITMGALEDHFGLTIDASAIKASDLSEQTREILKNLDEDVYLYTVYQPATSSELRIQVEEMLRSYAARSSHVKVGTINPINEPLRVNALSGGKTLSEGAVIITNADESRVKALNASDYYYTSQSSLTGGSYTVFSAETKVTAGILFVTSDKTNNVYFLQGHREPNYQNYCTILAAQLDNNSYQVSNLDLTAEGAALVKGDVLVIMDPLVDLSDEEYTAIRAWLDDGGRLLMCMNYSIDMSEMSNFVKLLDYYQMGFDTGYIQENRNSTTNWRQDVTYLMPNLDTEHEITADLTAYQILPYARPIKDVEMPESGSVYTKLMTTSTSATTVQQDGATSVGQRCVALSMQNKTGGAREDQTRIVLLGSEYVLFDMMASQTYNINFATNVIGWLADVEAESASITPELVDSNSLVISGSDIWIIVALVVVAMPLIAAIAGVVVWLRRRRL